MFDGNGVTGAVLAVGYYALFLGSGMYIGRKLLCKERYSIVMQYLVGSVAGVLALQRFPLLFAFVFDFSMTALFLVVFVEQWKSTKNHASALTGVAASVVCLLIFGAGNFVIPAMISITVILILMKKFRKGSEKAAEKGEVEHV